MTKAKIKISFRQIINAASQSPFEQNVLNYSYEEFKLKSQAYNPDSRYTSFSQLKNADGRANSLHYKCGFAVAGLIESLNKEVPGVLDTMGRSIAFDMYEFELIESDLTNKLLHKAAIIYTTEELALIDSIADTLLVSKKIIPHGLTEEQDLFFMLKLQAGLSITDYKQE